MDTGHGGTYDPVMPVCARCGEDNPARARFCLACAAPLTAPAAARREERKRVSVLFCDLVGFTSRAERLDVEDDPERAVRAALAIRDAIAELNQADPSLGLQVRVGVTSGEALVVLDARPVEGEGMASGDVVNTAARLQAAAPSDGILVDEATFRATDRQIHYQPGEPVAAKGKTDPVPVWLAVAARANLGVEVDQAGRAGLVGREREVRLLESALERVRGEHAPQLVTLVGVPGIGKSRLVWELLQTVEADPELVTWRHGRCLPYGEGVALWALGEIVKAQAGILESDPADVAEAKLARTVIGLLGDPTEAAWVTRHLRPLVGLGGTSQVGGDRQAEGFAAWRRFLEALAEQGPAPTRWFQAAAAMAAGRFAEAADRFAEIGSLPDEAFARLRAAERLLAVGARTEGGAQLKRALAFFRQVGAGGYLSRAEALVAASA
jgi:class 3 adenylate cyclase